MKEGAETALAKAESVLKQGADHFKGMSCDIQIHFPEEKTICMYFLLLF